MVKDNIAHMLRHPLRLPLHPPRPPSLKSWTMKWERNNMWHNTAMGWNSGDDPKSQVKVKFDDLDAAISFAERNGWPYVVEEPLERRSFDQEKSYDYNFLMEHVQVRRRDEEMRLRRRDEIEKRLGRE